MSFLIQLNEQCTDGGGFLHRSVICQLITWLGTHRLVCLQLIQEALPVLEVVIDPVVSSAVDVCQEPLSVLRNKDAWLPFKAKKCNSYKDEWKTVWRKIILVYLIVVCLIKLPNAFNQKPLHSCHRMSKIKLGHKFLYLVLCKLDVTEQV